MTDLDLKRMIGAALMVRPTDNWHYPLSENQLRHLVTQAVEAERERMKSEGYRKCAEGQKTTQFCGMLEAAVEAEREACIKIIEAYQIPIGNSPAGEMARDWTVDALKYIRDEIRARGESK